MHATRTALFILENLNTEKITNAWKWGIDCKCEADYPEYGRGECPCGEWDSCGKCGWRRMEDPECYYCENSFPPKDAAAASGGS